MTPIADHLCTACGTLHKIRAKRGEGTKAMKNKTELNDACINLLAFILSNHPKDWWDRETIFREYKGSTVGGTMARIGDLLGAGLLEHTTTNIYRQTTDAGHNTDVGLYRLNFNRAIAVLNSGGALA